MYSLTVRPNEPEVIGPEYWAAFGEVLTVADLCRIYRRRPPTIFRYLNDGAVPGHRFGRTWIVYRESVMRSIENGEPYSGVPEDLLDTLPEELGIEHLERLYGKSPNVLYTWLGSGLIPGHKYRHAWLIYKTEQIEALRRASNLSEGTEPAN